MARDKNVKVIPPCPFAATMFNKTEDIKDVLKSYIESTEPFKEYQKMNYP